MKWMNNKKQANLLSCERKLNIRERFTDLIDLQLMILTSYSPKRFDILWEN